ncbi:MAG: CCA tRNA nucleotidyltransferase [Pseudopedobacter sp.]|nr:CCA tRNA nucleotidyltransferase [Deinococcales bacterium]
MSEATQKFPLEQLLNTLTEAVTKAGGTPFLVGGAVRDGLLGLESKDIDVLVTNLESETLKTVLEGVGKVDLVGKSFGVFKVSSEGETLDVALPRLERSTGTHHRDFEVDYNAFLPLEADLERRDFTVNAMAWALSLESADSRHQISDIRFQTSEKSLIDPFEGKSDLERRILRAVGNPRARFEDDPLRMLRLARFVAKLDFFVEEETALAVRENAYLIETVALERVQTELMGLLAAPHPDGVLRALRFLRDSTLLERILPEFKATFGFEQQNPYHHLTLEEHIFAAVRYAVEHGFNPLSRLALLLHDLGKPETQSFGEDGVAHYYKHEEVGAEMAEGILERLKFPLEVQKSVVKLVRQHMRPPLDASTRVLRRFINDLGPDWERALEVRVSDRMAHTFEPNFDAVAWLDAARARALEVSNELEHFDERQLAISGLELVKLFGVQGSAIGDLKKRIARAVVEGEVSNEREGILRWLEAQERG